MPRPCSQPCPSGGMVAMREKGTPTAPIPRMSHATGRDMARYCCQPEVATCDYAGCALGWEPFSGQVCMVAASTPYTGRRWDGGRASGGAAGAGVAAEAGPEDCGG